MQTSFAGVAVHSWAYDDMRLLTRCQGYVGVQSQGAFPWDYSVHSFAGLGMSK